MPRMRSIKPEFWDDKSLSAVSRDARLLYIAMWNFADEEARMHGDARWIKGHCLPYDDDLNLAAVERLLGELERSGRVVRYEIDGCSYVYLPKLAKHQRLEPGRVPSRLPAPPLTSDDSSSERGASSFPPTVTPSEPIVTQHVAGGMEHVASGRWQVAAREDARHTADDLLTEHVNAHRAKVPNAVVNNTRNQIRALLGEGFDPDQIRSGLAVLRNKALGPSALPSAVNEAINAPRSRGSTTNQRVNDALSIAERLREQETIPTQRAIGAGT